MYLTLSDYRKLIKDEVLQIVTSNDNDIRTDAEMAAQQQMESYLSSKYDIRAVFLGYDTFSDTSSYDVALRMVQNNAVYEAIAIVSPGAFNPTEWKLIFMRSPLITMYYVDMVLYHVHTRISPRNVPEMRDDRYRAAIKWLHDVSIGELSPLLPLADRKSVV